MSHVNWESDDIFIASHAPFTPAEVLAKKPHLKGHVLIKSSGTTGIPKWVCISKKAILTSAASVNSNINAKAHDIWCQALPSGHIGGLAIYARAHLTKSMVVDWRSINQKWDVDLFYKEFLNFEASFTSLVPSQIYDLCVLNLRAPDTLKAVLVGGAALSEALYKKARALGWPLLPSYGMTETSSQIASANLESLKSSDYPILKILAHAQVKNNNVKQLMVKSEALFTCYLTEQLEEINPIHDGWFETLDLVEIKNGGLLPQGRINDQVKIAGELVSKTNLENIFLNITLHDPRYTLVFIEDERLGVKLVMHSEKSASEPQAKLILKEFNSLVRPFEKIRELIFVENIPRTELGKAILK